MAVTAQLPNEMKHDIDLLTGCVAGAETIDRMERTVRDARFDAVRITPKDQSRELIREWVPGRQLEDYVVSVYVEGKKPIA